MTAPAKLHGTAAERAALNEVASAVRSLLAACDQAKLTGDWSKDAGICAVFDRTFASKDEVSVNEAKRLARSVAMYVHTWVQGPLNAAVDSMNGEPTRDDLDLLDAYIRGFGGL